MRLAPQVSTNCLELPCLGAIALRWPSGSGGGPARRVSSPPAKILPFRARNHRYAHAAVIAGPPQRPRERRTSARRRGSPSWVAFSRRRKAAPPRPSARVGERCRIDAIDRFLTDRDRASHRTMILGMLLALASAVGTNVPFLCRTRPADPGSTPVAERDRSALLAMVRGRVDGRDPGLGPARRRSRSRPCRSCRPSSPADSCSSASALGVRSSGDGRDALRSRSGTRRRPAGAGLLGPTKRLRAARPGRARAACARRSRRG